MPGHLPLARAVALAAVLAACSGPAERAEPVLPMEEEAYVEVMARLDLLRRSPVPAEEPEAREALADSARGALLAERGLEPEHLLRFAEIVGSDPARMETIAGRIAVLSDSLRSAAAAAARDSLAAARDSAARDTLAAAGDSGPATPDRLPRDPVATEGDSAAVPDPAGERPTRLVPRPERRLRPPARRRVPATASDSGAKSGAAPAPDPG